MTLRFLPSLLVFISAYFPLALIFVIQDMDEHTFVPHHPRAAAAVLVVVALSVATVLAAARTMRGGLPVRIARASNKSGDMFTYAIPYMLSVNKFDFGDWRTLAGIGIFLLMMFLLSHRTQNVLVNPVLALAGYGLYDCQFKDGERDAQALLISRRVLQAGDACTVRRLSAFLYFVTPAPTEPPHDGSRSDGDRPAR